jgi:hypothetical protein
MNTVKQWLTNNEAQRKAQQLPAQHLYVLLDCASDKELPECVINLDKQAKRHSLFEETPLAEIADTGPFLISVNQKSAVFAYLLAKISKQPWGYFILSHDDIETLSNRLQVFLNAQMPDGKSYLFRFYDPRVIFNQLRVLSDDKLNSLFDKGNFLVLPEFEGLHWLSVNHQGEIQQLSRL